MDNKNTIMPDEISKVIQNKMIEEKKKMINDIYELTVNAPRNKLPFSIFKSYFAPHIFNKVEEDKKDPEIIKKWISIAGAASAGVDVFDDTTNEVVFTTPGIFDTSLINPIVDGGLPFGNIINQYRLRMDRLPSDGERYLKDRAAVKLEQTVSDNTAIIEETTKVWAEIYKRCYSESDDNKNKAPGVIKKLSTNDDDDLQHDFN